jgi:hypothetical protein
MCCYEPRSVLTPDIFPVVTADQLKMQEALGNADLALEITTNVPEFPEAVEDATLLLSHADPALRDRLIRRLSHRAGIMRIDNDMFDMAWKIVVMLISLMIRPACDELRFTAESSTRNQGRRRRLASHETIRNVPPLSVFTEGVVLHTIVPRQIEDAALSVVGSLLPHKVYGEMWLVPDKEDDSSEWWDAQDTAIADAEACYEFEGDDEDVEMHDSMEDMELFDSDDGGTVEYNDYSSTGDTEDEDSDDTLGDNSGQEEDLMEEEWLGGEFAEPDMDQIIQ